MIWGTVLHKKAPNNTDTPPQIHTKAAFLVTQNEFDISACHLCWYPFYAAARNAFFFFFLPNRGWELITEWAYLCSQSSRLGLQELSRWLRMLMWISLRVRKRFSDVATRPSNGFFGVHYRRHEKTVQQAARGCRSPRVLVDISKREEISFVYEENEDLASISRA